MKNLALHLAPPILSLAIFVFLFQLWKIDLTLPIFLYDGDAWHAAFTIKSIIDQGWFLSNDLVGLPHVTQNFSMYDFPLQADSFHFLIIKFFAYFSSNPFLVLNCFFLTSFFLVSASSFVVLRSFKISSFIAIIISILYSFTPYHFARNVSHLFLSNYVAIPLITMVALWIMEQKVQLISIDKKQQFCLAPNRFFFAALLISCFAAANGIYYGLYGAVIFIFAWFLASLKNGDLLNRNGFVALTLSFAIIFTLFCLYLPSLNYWLSNGLNGGVSNRGPSESELFGLRIIDLFLPVENHYFDYFANLRRSFDKMVSGGIGERGAESLGILAASGFLFLLLWVLAKGQNGEKSFLQKTIHRFSLSERDQELISNLAGLNLLVILTATVGGLVMFVALPFSLIRSHARFSIFIAFFSLFLVAMIFDKIIKKKLCGGKILAQILILIVAVFSLLDQVGRVSADSIQTIEMKNRFFSDRDFVQEIEKQMPENSMIFMMPLLRFPEGEDGYGMLVAYLHSRSLRWSQPAIYGRESYLWQKKTAALGFEDFISELKKMGFRGIHIDREQLGKRPELAGLEPYLQKITNLPAIISPNLQFAFYAI